MERLGTSGAIHMTEWSFRSLAGVNFWSCYKRAPVTADYSLSACGVLGSVWRVSMLHPILKPLGVL